MVEIFGIKEIDKWMPQESSILHIYGEKGTGKTTLGHHAIINSLSEGDALIYYLSVGKQFDPRRLKQLANLRKLTEDLDRVVVFNIETFKEQAKFFDLLPIFALNRIIKLLVIDSFTALFLNKILSLKKNKDKTYYNLELNRECAILRYIITEYMKRGHIIHIIIVNDVIFSPKRGETPIAKNILDFWTDLDIYMFSKYESYEKHKYISIMPQEITIEYTLTDRGIIIK